MTAPQKKPPQKPQKKKGFLHSRKLKWAFYTVVAWGAANYYVPEIGDSISQKFNELAETHAVLDMQNPNPFLKEQELKDVDLYNRRNIKLMGEEAENDFFANVDIADKWYAALGRYEMLMDDRDNRAFMQQWLRSLNHLRGKSIAEQATEVDAIVDRLIEYTPDPALYGKRDYFASPIETLWHKKGDCDDFAILKYFALRYLGVPDEHMYVVAVGDQNDNILDHATLLVDVKEKGVGAKIASALTPDWIEELVTNHKDTDFRVLDNDGSEIGRLIEEDKSRYLPYYAMNAQSFWRVPKNTNLWK
ncbi:MAG: hypothetical protein EP349_09550 [Alphaproteobacteria bacterium]|nr:MAG: hypothetical protein EP349_09550 [Alphaproteobacteria bacterium]